MPLFSNESLETLRQRIDIAEVISGYIDLQRAGAAYKALCPFHDEKSPSFMIQKGDHHYHCFGCGAHGDAIQFLMNYQNMSFTDAVEALAQKFGVHLEIIEGTTEYKGPSKAKLKEALETASRFYHFILLHTPEGHQALEYLYQRGIDLDFIQRFQIGLAPKAPKIFQETMKEKGHVKEILLSAGLLKEAANGRMMDFFYDRITFPIHNPAGAVIGFSARKYKEETFGGKYVNTPETPLFKKSRILFGLNHSRRRIAKERQAIIVEGQIDALRLIQEGFDIAVAGQGTAFGEGHVQELLTLGINQVYLALDSDNAGVEAAVKIGNLFQKEGVEVQIVKMPHNGDPDSYLQERGPDAFGLLLKTSEPYLDFLVKHQSKSLNVNSPAGKNELVNRISRQIRTWNESLMVHESLRKLAHLTGVPEEMIGVGQDFLPNLHVRQSGRAGVLEINPDRILESDFLRWIFLVPNMTEFASLHLRPEDLLDAVCQRVFQTFLQYHSDEKKVDLLSLIQQVGEVEGQELIEEIMKKKVNREKAEEHLVETIQRIMDRNWMRNREKIKQKIQSGTCSDDEVLQLVKEFDELRKNPPKVNREASSLL